MTTFPEILRRMAADFASLPHHLEKVIKTAPLRYKDFTIPKRDGSPREVAQPAREVKMIQRWLVRELRNHLPVHDSAMAYEPGKSIEKNARAHVKSGYLLKMDFTGFFRSITAPDITRHLDKYCAQQYTVEERDLIARACTWLPKRADVLQLCIGAPSSPLLSNSIMFDFDCLIAEQAQRDGVTYTRYADDLTFSCTRKHVLPDYVEFVRGTLGHLVYPKVSVNEQKTVHASRAGHRMVTGVVITPNGALSVGRDRKRLIRAMYHRSTLGRLTAEEQMELAGLIAFVESIEPGFSAKLKGPVKP